MTGVIELKNETVYDQISKIANQTPEAVAIRHKNRSLSYKMLERGSNQLANLLAVSVGEHKNIAIFLENGIELIQAAVGIMKAGCVFVAVDTSYPENRIRMMIEKVDASWLVTTSDYLGDLHKLLGQELQHMQIILMDEKEPVFTDASLKLSYSKDYSGEMMMWERNAYSYINFTSGSTGIPKAILGKHRSLKHFIDWEIKELGLDENCIGSQLSSSSFDPFLRDVFVPLCAGGTVCIPDNRELLLSSQALEQWISLNNITLIHIVPTLFRLLMDSVRDASSFPSLQYVLLAGELVRGRDVKKFFDIFKERIQLLNLYGPAEATMSKAFYRIQPSDGDLLTIPIGKPIPGAQLLILNADMQRSPAGSVGEIYVRTPYLTAGYYRDKAANAKVFIKNPFNDNKNDILYKSGDKGRLLASGDYEIMGRVDYQVKVHAVRIEPEEIESRMTSHPSIKQAAVIAREDDLGEKYLAAYIVSDEEITGSELRRYLSEYLPDYMIPSHFVRMEKFPLTPNGKVDRKAFPEPLGKASAEYVRPRNQVEESLVQIWSEVLNKEQVGIYDNFFELGGHSLKGTFLLARIHKELNVEVSMKELFKTPTIAGISEYIASAAESVYASIEVAEVKEYYEVSSAQTRMWLLQQFNPESTGYNISGALSIVGNLDRKRVESAFCDLVMRHEALRTSFTTVDNEIVQKIDAEIKFEVEYSQMNAEGEIDDIIKDFIRPFDLTKAPLFRVVLIKRLEDQYHLLFDMHHIISDGASMAILTEEFIALYNGAKLRTPRIQYKDFSVWQNEYLKSDKMRGQEEYWLEQLSDVPILNIPLDYPRPSVQSFEGENVEFNLNSELTEKLNSLARKTGTTLYMVLLSAINILLSKYTDQEDIIIGSPIAGRPHADLEKIIGMFVGTLAMRNYPQSDKTYAEFLNEVKETALKAYENQDYQFEELVNKLNLPRDLSRNPLFDVMFVLQNTEFTAPPMEGLKLTSDSTDQTVVKFDLKFTATEIKDQVLFSIEYCTSLFKRETIERLCLHLQNLIEMIVANKEMLLGDMDILLKEERDKILYEFNDTYAEYPREKTLHQLFEEQVEKTPDNPALIFGGQILTYCELNEKSNQLARRLREKGVGPDIIVGIMVERSMEMIIGIMGILKSGGAYLPIDPDYPEERINFILEDSKPVILLTQSWLNARVGFSGEKINLDEVEFNQVQEKSKNLERVNHANNLAYVIYTSGSTGKPKGTLVEHQAIVNRLIWMQTAYPLTEADVLLQKTTYTFDVSVWELLWWSFTGAKVCILEPKQEKDPSAIIQAIEKNHVTIMHFVPSMLSVFLEYVKQDNKISRIKTLRKVFASGEALTIKQAQDFERRIHQTNKTDLINLYGPTEAAVDVTYFNTSTDFFDKTVPIGKPISNISLYVLNKNNTLNSIGIPGELHIGGDGLARGYLNRPELTAEKFVPNPFIKGSRMYRTGDLVRLLPDGNIEFLGRIDHQVKIRGFRIELGEIESEILQLDGVKETLVLAREDQTSDKYLCAYLVAEGEIKADELKKYLTKKLPEYMIPSHFVQLEKMPLTLNGKADRRALPEPERELSIEYVAPRNMTEETLVRIWGNVLGSDIVGIHDNFFDLGGHSLKAAMTVNKINDELRINVSLAEFYANPSIAGIMEHINRLEEDEVKHVAGLLLIKKGKPNGSNHFMIHGGQGKAAAYLKLSNHMSNEFNYWGINYENPASYDPCVMPLEQLAASYIKKMKRIQETGPYYISGWCLGGFITFEMARQLEAAGAEVKFVGLYNTSGMERNIFHSFARMKFTIKGELELIGRIFSEDDFSEKYQAIISIEELWTQVVRDLTRAANGHELVKEKVYQQICLESPFIEKMIKDYTQAEIGDIIHCFNLLRGLNHICSLYNPKVKINAKISYFSALREERNNKILWNKYSYQKVDFHSVDADHFSMFGDDEDVKKLAHALTKALSG